MNTDPKLEIGLSNGEPLVVFGFGHERPAITLDPGTVLALYGLTLCGLALLYVYHIDTRGEE
jgi:hypothetical protein